MFMMPSIIGFYPAENRIYAVLLLIFRFNYMAVALQQILLFLPPHTCKQNNFEKCKKMTIASMQRAASSRRRARRLHLSHFTWYLCRFSFCFCSPSSVACSMHSSKKSGSKLSSVEASLAPLHARRNVDWQLTKRNMWLRQFGAIIFIPYKIRNKWHIKAAHLVRSCGFARANETCSHLSVESMEHATDVSCQIKFHNSHPASLKQITILLREMEEVHGF